MKGKIRDYFFLAMGIYLIVYRLIDGLHNVYAWIMLVVGAFLAIVSLVSILTAKKENE